MVATTTTGKLSKDCFDQTQNYVFTASTTIATTTTRGLIASSTPAQPLVLNGIPYSTPSTQGASTTVLMENGSGALTWERTNMGLLDATTTANVMLEATSTFSAATHLQFTLYVAGMGGATRPSLKFNSDSGSNYGFTNIDDNGVPNKVANNGSIELVTQSTTSPSFWIIDVYNPLTSRKFLTWTGTTQSSAAASPVITQGSAVWNNTSAQITTLILDVIGNDTLTAGSKLNVYGSSY